MTQTVNDTQRTTAIIVPCYNEARRFNTQTYQSIMSGFPQYLFCFVDDGSTDDTLKVLREFESQHNNRVRVLTHTVNQGKAEAIRTGVNFLLTQQTAHFVGFMDADLSTPFTEIDCMDNILRGSDHLEIVCGSRIKRMGSRIIRKGTRHYTGRIIATMISMILKMPFYDTQCGAKIMRLKVASLCFKEPFNTSWLFDVEVFKRMQIHFKEQTDQVIYEHPLREWVHMEESKVKLTYVFMLPIHLILIHLKYK